MNVLDKIEEFKALVKKEFGHVDDRDLKKMVTHLCNQTQGGRYKKTKIKLTPDEFKLYELCFRHNYMPDTVYKWFLVEELPEEAKEKIREGSWSFRRAYAEKRHFASYDKATTEDLINAIIRCVEMFYVEPDVEREVGI